MWYEKSYRRHLVDMHVEDWSEEFLSEFSADEYLKNLLTAKVQNAMIYLQSHVGLCYFPTKIGVMHKAFIGRENEMRKLIDGCRKNGIFVTAYYSLNYNTVEHDRHDEWKLVEANGKSLRDSAGTKTDDQALAFASAKSGRYGLCCPNNEDYRKFTFQQIAEMIEYCGDIQGVFFDMPFWRHTCYCDKCKARWKNEVGGEMPVNPKEGSEENLLLVRKKLQWMGEWINAVTTFVKGKYPSLSVEHNFAQAIAGDSNSGCGEEVNEACDFVGGDLYGGILNHSFACKFYKNITKNQPFDYMFSRCKPALRSHTLTKTEDEMMAEIMITTAHHGATMVIDAIDPKGTFDRRVYERFGKIFGEEEKYEAYLDGKMVEEIGVYFSIRSKYIAHEDGYEHKKAALNATKTLIQKHYPMGVTGNFYSLENYKLIIMPLISKEERDFERIVKFVSNGGKLYMSGAENPKLLEKLTGLKAVGRANEKMVYIAPKASGFMLDFNEEYPLPFEGSVPLVQKSREVEVLATLTLPYTRSDETRFASIHSDPPGRKTDYPMIVRSRYGKGEVIWSAAPIEAVEFYEYREIFTNLVNLLLPSYNPAFKCDGADYVELTLFEHNGYKTLNLVNLDEKAIMEKLPPFKVSVALLVKPKKVTLIPSGKEIPFKYSNGYAEWTVDDFRIFSMFKIE